MIVCGTKGRYAELVAGLQAAGRKVALVRFNNDAPDAFDADVVHAAAGLGVVHAAAGLGV